MTARHLAPLSLAIATIMFAATLPFRDVFACALLNAFAEAAMIGGLADWFAVVALFRHPLGIPIPHTAIIPAHRARLTQGIIDLVQNTWLNKDAIRARVQSWDVAASLGTWLSSPLTRSAIRTAAATMLRELLRDVDAGRIAGGIQSALRERITPSDLARYARRTGDRLLADRLHQPIVDAALSQAAVWLASPAVHKAVADTLRNAADSYAQSPLRRLGKWIAENAGALEYGDLATAILGALREDIDAILADTAHPARAEADAQLTRLLEALTSEDGEAPLAASLHTAIFGGEAVRDALANAAAQARTWLLEDVDRADSMLGAQLDALLQRARQRLETDAAARQAVDSWAKERIVHLVDEYHDEIGALVRDNLDRLDDTRLVEQIEGKVGGDLQYIRVNGAVVGGLVGAVLFLLKFFLA